MLICRFFRSKAARSKSKKTLTDRLHNDRCSKTKKNRSQVKSILLGESARDNFLHVPEGERETRAKCQNQSGELLIRERSFAEARDFRIESINARFFLPLCGALSSALHFLIGAKTEKVATSVGHRILLSDGDFVARLDDLL